MTVMDSGCIVEYQLSSQLFSDEHRVGVDYTSKVASSNFANAATVTRTLSFKNIDYIAVLSEKKITIITSNTSDQLTVELPPIVVDDECSYRDMCWVGENDLPTLFVLIDKRTISAPLLFQFIFTATVKTGLIGELLGPISPPSRRKPHLVALIFSTRLSDLPMINIVYSDLFIESIVANLDNDSISWISSNSSSMKDWQLDSCVYNDPMKVLVAIGSQQPHKNAQAKSSSAHLGMRFLVPTVSGEVVRWKEVVASDTGILHHVHQTVEETYPMEKLQLPISAHKIIFLSQLFFLIKDMLVAIVKFVSYLSKLVLTEGAPAYARLVQLSSSPDGRYVIVLHADDSVSVVEICDSESTAVVARVVSHRELLSYQLPGTKSAAAHAVAVQFLGQDLFVKLSRCGEMSIWKLRMDDGGSAVLELLSPSNSSAGNFNRWLQVPPPIGLSTTKSTHFVINEENRTKLFFLRRLGGATSTFQLLSMCTQTALESIHNSILGSARPLTVMAVDAAKAIAMDANPSLGDTVHKLLWTRWRGETDRIMRTAALYQKEDDSFSFYESILAHSEELSKRNISKENFADSLQQSNHLTLFLFMPLDIIRQIENDTAFICKEVLQVVALLVEWSWAIEESSGSDISIELCLNLIEEAIQRIHLCNVSPGEYKGEPEATVDFDVLRKLLCTEKEKLKLLQSIIDEEMRQVSLNRSGLGNDVEDTLFENVDTKSLVLGNTRALLSRRLLNDLRRKTPSLDLVAIALCIAQRALSAGLLIATLELSPEMNTPTIISVLEECPASLEPSNCVTEVLQWWMVKRRSELDVTVNASGEMNNQLRDELDLLSRWSIHRALTLVRCGFPVYAFRLADAVVHIVDAIETSLDSSSPSFRSEDFSNTILLHRELYYFCQFIGNSSGRFDADFFSWLQQSCEGRIRYLLASCTLESQSQSDYIISTFLIFKALYCNFERPYLISALHASAYLRQAVNRFLSTDCANLAVVVSQRSKTATQNQEKQQGDTIFDSILVDQLTEYISLPFAEKKQRSNILHQVLAVVSASSPTLPVGQRIIGASKQLLRLVIGACVAFDDIADDLDTLWQLLEFTPKSVVFDLREDPDSENELSLLSHELDTIQQALTISEIVKNYMPIPPLSIFMVRRRRIGRELTIEEWFRNCPIFCSRVKSKRLRLYRHQLKTELLKGVRYLMAPSESTAESESKTLDSPESRQLAEFTLEQCLMAQMCSSVMKVSPENDADLLARLTALATDLQTICSLHFSTEGSLSAESKFEITLQQSTWAARLFFRCLLDSDYSNSENIYTPIVKYFCSVGSSTDEGIEPLCDTLNSMKLSRSLVIQLILHHCKELINSLSSCCMTLPSDSGDEDCSAYSKFALARNLLSCIETGEQNTLHYDEDIVSEKIFLEMVTFFRSLEMELAPIQVRLMQPSKSLALILQERPQAYYSIVNWNAFPNLNVRDADECLYGSVLAYRDSLKARTCPGQEFLNDLQTAANKRDSMSGLVRLLLEAALEFQDSENVYCLCLELIKLNTITGDGSHPARLSETSESDDAMKVILDCIYHFETIARTKDSPTNIDENQSDTKIRFAIDEPSTLSFLANDLRAEFLASSSLHQLNRLMPASQLSAGRDGSLLRALMHELLSAMDRPDFLSTKNVLRSISAQSKFEEAILHSLISDKSESLSMIKTLVTELETQLIQWRLSPAGQQFDRFRHNSSTDLPPPDSDMINKIISKGFSNNGAKRAVYYSRSVSVENALSWAVEHCNDQDFDFPLALTVRGALKPEPIGDLPNGLLVSGECLPVAITFLQERFVKLLSSESAHVQSVHPIHSFMEIDQASGEPLITDQKIAAPSELALMEPVRNEKKSSSRRTGTNSPKKPLLSKAKTATRLKADVNDVKDFIDFDFDMEENKDTPNSGESKHEEVPINNLLNISTDVSLPENLDETFLRDQQPVDQDTPLAETVQDDQRDDSNIFIEDIYPDINVDSAVGDVAVADFHSPLRSQAVEFTKVSEQPQVPETADVVNPVLVTSLQDLKSAIEIALTDNVYLSLISEDIRSRLNLSEEILRFNCVMKEEYLMTLQNRCDDSLSDIVGLSFELAKDVLSISPTSTESKLPDSPPTKGMLIEIILLAVSQDDADASIKLVECLSVSAPTFLKEFEDYSAPILRKLLHLTHVDAVVSTQAPLDWYLRLLSIQDQAKKDRSASIKDNLQNSFENNLKIFRSCPHLSLIVLDGLYCSADGRQIGVVELLKKCAIEVLRPFKESDQEESNQSEFLSITDLLIHCQCISTIGRTQSERTTAQRHAALDKAVASLEEDVSSLRRISRVPEHERGDSRKIIKSEHLISGCFDLRLLQSKKALPIEAATAVEDRARVVAIAELIVPSYAINHLPLLRARNVQDWIRAVGRILSVGPSELHFLCLWSYITRLWSKDNDSMDHPAEAEWFNEFSQAADVAVAKLRTNHFIILALISLGVPLGRVETLLSCPVTSLLIDVSAIGIAYEQKKPFANQASSTRLVAQKLIERLREAMRVHIASKSEGSLSFEAENISTFLRSLEAFNSSILASSRGKCRQLEDVFLHVLNQSIGVKDKKEFLRNCREFYIPTILDSDLSVEAVGSLFTALLVHHPVISDCIHGIGGEEPIRKPEKIAADEDTTALIASAVFASYRNKLSKFDGEFISEDGAPADEWGGRVEGLFSLHSNLAAANLKRAYDLSVTLLPCGACGTKPFDMIIDQISQDFRSNAGSKSSVLADKNSVIHLTISKDEDSEFFDFVKEFAAYSTCDDSTMGYKDSSFCEVPVPHSRALYLLLQMKTTIQAAAYRMRVSSDGNEIARSNILIVETLRSYLSSIIETYVPNISNTEENSANWNTMKDLDSITLSADKVLNSEEETTSVQFQVLVMSVFNLYRIWRWKDSHSPISLQKYYQLRLHAGYQDNFREHLDTSSFGAILVLVKLFIRAKSWISLELVAATELSTLGRRPEEHVKKYVDSIRQELLLSPIYIQEEVDILLGGSYRAEAVQLLSSRLSDCEVLTHEELLRSMCSFLLVLTFSTAGEDREDRESPPLSQLTQSPAWRFLGAVLRTIQSRARLVVVDDSNPSDCSPLVQDLYLTLILNESEEAGSPRSLHWWARLLSPCRICASLVAHGMVLEAALLFWQTSAVLSVHAVEFDLCLSLDRLLKELEGLGERGGEGAVREAIEALSEWLGAPGTLK